MRMDALKVWVADLAHGKACNGSQRHLCVSLYFRREAFLYAHHILCPNNRKLLYLDGAFREQASSAFRNAKLDGDE